MSITASTAMILAAHADVRFPRNELRPVAASEQRIQPTRFRPGLRVKVVTEEGEADAIIRL